MGGNEYDKMATFVATTRFQTCGEPRGSDPGDSRHTPKRNGRNAYKVALTRAVTVDDGGRNKKGRPRGTALLS